MRTVAVIARKGGSGKTTIAFHLAIAAHIRGHRTVLADADPQRSSLSVLKGRAGPGPKGVETSGPKLFALQVAALREGVDTLIIDTAAGAEHEIAHAIVISDVSLLVVRPTFLDVAAVLRTAEIFRRLRKPGLAVLNQAPALRGPVETPAVKSARKALDYLGLDVVPATIRARAAYQTALEVGRSAEEAAPATGAATDIDSLWRHLDGVLARKRDR